MNLTVIGVVLICVSLIFFGCGFMGTSMIETFDDNLEIQDEEWNNARNSSFNDWYFCGIIIFIIGMALIVIGIKMS
jgi:hypothetical protein